MLELNETNWKCAKCTRYDNIQAPCFINVDGGLKYPDVRLEPSDDCSGFMNSDYVFKVDINSDPSKIIVSCIYGRKTFTGTVNRSNDWDDTTINYAIETAKQKIITEIENYQDLENATTDSIPDTDEENMENVDIEKIMKTLSELTTKVNSIVDNNNSDKTSNTNDDVEKMLDGDTHISWFERVTSWNRVLNAARRTIGRKPLEKEPTDSWKAKILLAEHSPIRLLEYDFGWEKIRQWVTAHFVRHHEGCEKFVHSQRGDRRAILEEYNVETRDELPQGALNDMDMSANAQALINISRKRLCNCASKETREAWIAVKESIRKIDPIMADKMVPECIYRGFCPEFLSPCGYSKTQKYQEDLIKYRNTEYNG